MYDDEMEVDKEENEDEKAKGVEQENADQDVEMTDVEPSRQASTGEEMMQIMEEQEEVMAKDVLTYEDYEKVRFDLEKLLGIWRRDTALYRQVQPIVFAVLLLKCLSHRVRHCGAIWYTLQRNILLVYANNYASYWSQRRDQGLLEITGLESD
jgi:hypothetical protein